MPRDRSHGPASSSGQSAAAQLTLKKALKAEIGQIKADTIETPTRPTATIKSFGEVTDQRVTRGGSPSV